MATELINPDRVQTFFNSLETHKTLLTTCTDLYKSITDHFSSLHNSLTTKSEALDSKIQAFNAQSDETLASLTHCENSIPELESVAAARIEEQKELAVSEIENAARAFNRRVCGNGEVVLSADGFEWIGEVFGVEKERIYGDKIGDRGGNGGGSGGCAEIGIARWWACGVLVQGLFEFGGELGVKGVKGVAAITVERAASVASKWKEVVEVEEGGGGMGTAEEETGVDQVEEEFTVWKKNTPFLYDLILSHPLEWPSLTVQWLPSSPTVESFAAQKLILGTHTSDGVPNFLMIADALLPHSSITSSETHNAGDNPTIPKVEITQQIHVDGEVFFFQTVNSSST